MTVTNSKSIVVGVSGASGAVYAQRLLSLLAETETQVHVVFSDPGKAIFAQELGIKEISVKSLLGHESANFVLHDNQNLFSEISSGSFAVDGMVVCPCSSNSLAAMSAGLADNLLRRAGYVTLKQKRPLILVHREMPLTSIDLENMLRLTNAGATICPACPAFYQRPESIKDLVDGVTGRIMDLLEIEHNLPIRWSDPTG